MVRLGQVAIVAVVWLATACSGWAQRADLPDDAHDVLEQYDAARAEIRATYDQQMRELREKIIEKLQPLQDKHTRDGQLDEAVAIRDTITRLRLASTELLTLETLPKDWNAAVGKRFFLLLHPSEPFGTVWGTDEYTTDSHLAAAAVHAGVLRPGAAGVVELRIVAGRDQYGGSQRHGIATNDWGAYPTGMTFRAVPGLSRLPRNLQPIDLMEIDEP